MIFVDPFFGKTNESEQEPRVENPLIHHYGQPLSQSSPSLLNFVFLFEQHLLRQSRRPGAYLRPHLAHKGREVRVPLIYRKVEFLVNQALEFEYEYIVPFGLDYVLELDLEEHCVFRGIVLIKLPPFTRAALGGELLLFEVLIELLSHTHIEVCFPQIQLDAVLVLFGDLEIVIEYPIHVFFVLAYKTTEPLQVLQFVIIG